MKTRVKIIEGMHKGKYGYIDGHVSGTNNFAVVVVLDSGLIRYFEINELFAIIDVGENPKF